MDCKKKVISAVLLLALVGNCGIIPAAAYAETVPETPSLAAETTEQTVPETAETTVPETAFPEETVPAEETEAVTEPVEEVAEETWAAEEPEAPQKENAVTGTLAAGEFHTVWVMEDGTVAGVGAANAVAGLESWKHIVKVAGWKTTVGLKENGTVVGNTWGYENPAAAWSDIVDIDAGE